MSPSLPEASEERGDEEQQLETVVEEIALLTGDPAKPVANEDENETPPTGAKQRTCETICVQKKSCVQRLIQCYSDNYVLLVLSASFLEAMNATCIKVATRRVSLFQLAMIRGVFCATTLVGLCHWNGISLIEPRSKVHWFFLRGIVGATAFLCFFFAVFKLPLSEAAFLTNSYPAVTAAVSWLFGMEQLGAWTWFGIAGCGVGNALVAHPPFLFGGHEDWGPDRILGLITAAAANLLLASTFLIIRHIGKGTSTMVLTAYMQTFSFFISIPFVAIGYPVQFTLRMTWLEWLCLMEGCVFAVPVQMALSRALQIGPPSKVTSIFLTNMLIAAFMGAFALRERISWIGFLGAAVVLFSVILITNQRSEGTDTKYERIKTVESREEIELAVQEGP